MTNDAPDFGLLVRTAKERAEERHRLWMSDPEIREAMRINREKIKQAKKERKANDRPD